MSAPQSVTVSLRVAPGDGGSANPDDLYICHGQPGEWKLTAAYFVPLKDVTAHGSNNYSIQLEQGFEGTSTAISTALTTASTGMTVGTVRAFTLSENTSREFGPTDILFVDMDKSGSPANNIEGIIVAAFSQARV